MTDTQPTSAIIIIGDEILSGRTQDVNVKFIAEELFKMGIALKEVRVISDDEKAIIETVRLLSGKYTYVFTTGGIGPTHDDITAASMAKAFNRKFVLNKEAHERIVNFLQQRGRDITQGIKIMAMMPEDVSLIDNNISASPGFSIENVYVMAGIPEIMRDMFTNLKPYLKKSTSFISKEITAEAGEGKIADLLAKTQEAFRDISIGSYPFKKDGEYNVSIVVRGKNVQSIKDALKNIKNGLLSFGIKFTEKRT